MIYFEKSQPAPESLASEKLKASGKYNLEDVQERLNRDFKDKCYICETKSLTSREVDHFIPYNNDKGQEDINLKFSWDNLFLTCSHCNGIKGDRYQPLWNCTRADDHVESHMKFSLPPFPRAEVRVEALDDEERSINTSALLNAAYSGTTPGNKRDAANIRKNLAREIREFQSMLFHYDDESCTGDEKEHIRSQIVYNLSSSSAFTAFKRSIIRSIPDLNAEFGGLF
jgi:hypothetical protein